MATTSAHPHLRRPSDGRSASAPTFQPGEASFEDGSPMALTIDNMYPQAREQSMRLYAVVDRLKVVRDLVDQFIAFFKSIEASESRSSSEYNKALRHFTLLGMDKDALGNEGVIDEAATGPGIAGAIASVHAIGDHHAAIAKHIRDETLKSLDSILTIQNRRYKDMRGNIEKEAAGITKSRSDTLAAIATHVKAHHLVSVRRGSSSDLMDPWLTEMALHVQLLDMVDRENSYQIAMLAIIAAARDAEHHTLSQLKLVCAEYLSAHGAAALATRDTVGALQATVSRFDASWPFAAYAHQTGATSATVWHTPRSLSVFPYRVDLSAPDAVLRQGVLHRQGTIRTSKWKPSWFVLTELGFLHCFEEKEPPMAHPSSVVGSLPRTTTTGGASSESVGPDGKKVKLPKILFSVCLRQARTLVTYVPEKPYDHCFEVSVRQPRDTGLFSLKKKEVRYLIKAEDEETMVDWVCTIKRLIDAYAPPMPSPLYSQPDRLQDRIAAGGGGGGGDTHPPLSPVSILSSDPESDDPRDHDVTLPSRSPPSLPRSRSTPTSTAAPPLPPLPHNPSSSSSSSRPEIPPSPASASQQLPSARTSDADLPSFRGQGAAGRSADSVPVDSAADSGAPGMMGPPPVPLKSPRRGSGSRLRRPSDGADTAALRSF
ncbi:hypothetical protein BC828DRAFT_403802 [Blastocladiella britannica]|nr:hypothetical protein BC828DRAFT_403802 [Blastocladiella britannica]